MANIGSARRPFHRNGGQVFEPQVYWEDRHRTHQGSLRAVGHRQLSDEANAEQYRIKESRIIGMIRRQVPQPYGKTLLDAGCGVGVLIPAYVELGFSVVGVDFSDTAIGQAQVGGVSAQFVVSSLASLELGRRFDVITAIDVLLHIVADAEWADTLSSLSRHLKPGGALIILDRFADHTDGWSSHCRPRPKDRYAATFADLGLQIVEHEQFSLEHEDVLKDLFAVRHVTSEEPEGT